MQGLDGRIECVAANMPLVWIGKHNVFSEKLVDRNAALRSVVLSENIEQIAFQQSLDGI
jgi:hypothetical protein